MEKLRGPVLALALALGCGTTSTEVVTLRCTATTQPLPTDCALVHVAAKDPNGNPLGFLPVRVDSVVASLGQAYLSGSDISAGDGGFTLLVFRMNRFRQPDTPDTATVYIKGYASPSPALGAAAISHAAVVMRFSPLGDEVTPTVVTAAFHPLP